ncbi:MAG: dipeptide epimerase [Nitrospira sp.]|nr:dipeptide epimerase [Nitrospira sp.]
MNASSFTITNVEFCPLDLPITDPFVVATGQLQVAQNAFVRVTLHDGTTGYGEIAPFPAITGEDRESSLTKARILGEHLLGQSPLHYQRLGGEFSELAPDAPAARCGLETALLDTFTRAIRIPLWALWGGADVRVRETDITIPIASLERSRKLARHWHERGFRLFKIKVGHDVDDDIRRLEALHRECAGVSFVIDANQGYTYEEAATLIQGLNLFGGTLLLLEQPLAKDALEGHAKLRRDFRVPVAADESAQSLRDLQAVIRHEAADYVNIKITKSGLLEGILMATVAKAAGLRVMLGGMVETRVAMGCSYSIAMGLGGCPVLDLDTPLLLDTDPIDGGYTYEGPLLQPWYGPGLDFNIPSFQPAVSDRL